MSVRRLRRKPIDVGYRMSASHEGLPGLERLTRQVQSLLAVITMAALWQDRFQGGWVDLPAAAAISLHIEKTKPGAPPSEAARQAFYRARKALRSLGQPEVEDDEDRAAMRLATTPSSALQQWLWEHWAQFVTRESWQEFMCPASDWDIRHADVQVRARELLESGDSGALDALKTFEPPPQDLLVGVSQRKAIREITNERLRRVLWEVLWDPRHPLRRRHPIPRVLAAIARLRLGRFDARYVRHELQLTRANILIHGRSAESLASADTILCQLLAGLLPIRDIMDQLFAARLWIARARCRYFLSRLAGPLDPSEIALCDDALNRAEAYEAGLSPPDRGQILAIRAWIRLEDAIRTSDAGDKERFLAEARRLSRRAFQMGHLGRDKSGMREALFGLAVVDATQAQAQKPTTVDTLSLVWTVRCFALTFGTDLNELDYYHVWSPRSVPEQVGLPELMSPSGAAQVEERLDRFYQAIWRDHLTPVPAAMASEHAKAAYADYVHLAQCLIARSQHHDHAVVRGPDQCLAGPSDDDQVNVPRRRPRHLRERRTARRRR